MIYSSEFICGVLLTTFLITLPYSTLSCVALPHKTLHCSRTGLFIIPQTLVGYMPLLLLVKSSIPFSDSHSFSHNCVLSLLKKKKVKVTQSCPTLCDPMDCVLYYYSFLRYLFSPARVQLPWVSCLSQIPKVCLHCSRRLHSDNNNALKSSRK